MSAKNLARALAVFLLCSGCSYYPVRQRVDDYICSPTSLDPAQDSPAIARRTIPADKTVALDGQAKLQALAAGGGRGVDESFNILLASAQEQPKTPLSNRILEKIPGVPGWDVPPITVPVKGKDREAYIRATREVADKYFKRQPPLEKEFQPALGPNGVPLTLADLQRLARTNSPLLRQAAAAVESAKGAAQQAGMYPNPTATLIGSTAGPSGGPTNGPAVSQQIVTADKLGLAMAAAEKDLKMAEIALRRAETDLSYSVRTQYFAVLVAQESVKANHALAVLTDEVYNVFVDIFRNGAESISTYEPMQLAVFAQQARQSLVQARANYVEAWKILAANMGLSGMPPTQVQGQLTGQPHLPLPHFEYKETLAHILKNHTDVLTADQNIAKARYNLRSAQVQPIPDAYVSLGGLYDNTQPGPDRWITTFSVAAAIPIWNLNKGAIRQQQGVLMQMMEEPHRVRNALTATFADAFQRYDTNKTLLKQYNDEILPKQVQAFRGALRRYEFTVGEVGPWDVIGAEQNLVTVIGAYIPVLGNMWQAVADVANLLQTDDIFMGSKNVEPINLASLEAIIQCCHPCSPLRGPELHSIDPIYPPTADDVLRPLSPPSEKKPMMDMKPSSVVPQEMQLPPQYGVEFGTPIPMDDAAVLPRDLPSSVPVQVETNQTPPARYPGSSPYGGYRNNNPRD